MHLGGKVFCFPIWDGQIYRSGYFLCLLNSFVMLFGYFVVGIFKWCAWIKKDLLVSNDFQNLEKQNPCESKRGFRFEFLRSVRYVKLKWKWNRHMHVSSRVLFKWKVNWTCRSKRKLGSFCDSCEVAENSAVLQIWSVFGLRVPLINILLQRIIKRIPRFQSWHGPISPWQIWSTRYVVDINWAAETWMICISVFISWTYFRRNYREPNTALEIRNIVCAAVLTSFWRKRKREQKRV